MNKCLKITLTIDPVEGFLQDVIQQNARKYKLEGIVQTLSQDKVKIIVCGDKEQVDYFVDTIHKETDQSAIKDIEIEPYSKDRDYRGVFRVIE